MIEPNTLREKIAEIRPYIPEIKSVKFVVDDDEFAAELKDHAVNDNILLVVVVPSFNGFGKEDESGIRSFLQFFLMEKIDFKHFKTQDQYIDVFQKVLIVLRKFLKHIFHASESDESVNCLSMNLDYSSLKINPVTKKSQCNGWVIEIDEEKYEDF
ncbi:Uncharacterised protein [Chryseobacterium nakagawai]|uniref:Uncharacterized protein n=1 Tax=Chryseobacterium nakagawai TaxID=1241982 RepID=A0AAD0YQ77_CHRNA|nr:hypothetical protein [Chryseobacterium nakagawai]AZA93044.1 hypothetical protein EG343_21790 [Chryseobacterium nakagawai]VEH19677.1 Uncharacterised protein [Chryseobacterium nakagawai]